VGAIADMLRKEGNNFGFIHGFQPVYFNTGTIFDLEAGRLSEGKNGEFLIGGGFGNFITAVQGKGNMFKTTLILSLLIRSLEIYPDSNLIIVDTEGSIIASLTRLIRFANAKDRELLNRIHPIDGKVHSLANIYRIIVNILEERDKIHAKDLFIETPFVNLETKTPIKQRKPFHLFIDSFSELIVDEAQDLVKEGFDAGKFNTIHMASGNKKGSFFSQLNILSAKYGMSVILTTQLGAEIQMDPRALKTKQLTEMRQGERTKGASSKYETLPHIAYQMMTSGVYWADSNKKETKYPYDEYTQPKELHETTIKFVRQKINMSGSEITTFVLSQRDGLQSNLTNLDYLKRNEYYGLTPSQPGQWHASTFMPDKKFNRKSIRKLLDEDYALNRGLEICTHLHYVQEYWRPLIEKKYPNIVTPDILYERLSNPGSSIKLQDILESRGYWTYDPNNKRQFMNVFKIMDLLSSDVKTKSQSVVPETVTKKK